MEHRHTHFRDTIVPAILRRSQTALLVFLISCTVCLMIWSCARPTIRVAQDTLKDESNKQPSRDLNSNDIEMRIREEYRQWKGTRHVLGGDDQDGIDCSAFVQAIYKNVFHIDLPRTTKRQLYMGTPVSRNELRSGDLVFFKPPSAPRHVGIYLNEDQFIHASKSSGVTISQIDHIYWGKYFWTGRRILQ
jgi:lipoprotein Spr